jgi:hypothetical protein
LTDELQDDLPLGVYSTDASGEQTLVHRYEDGDYGLEDIYSHFQLGELESTDPSENTIIWLSDSELRELKVMADARSFDFEEGFIEMCLDVQRFSLDIMAERVQFIANF